MSVHELGFWICVFLIVYPYLLYPFLLALLARLRPARSKSPLPESSPPLGSVSVLVCAYNEEANIERRLLEFIDLFERTNLEGELLVVTDGSTDGTADIVRRYTSSRVRLLELPTRVGKAAALTHAAMQATGKYFVFADVRQTWSPDALHRLLENFTDPQIGAVSGDLVVTAKPGTLSGVSLYWRYEKWLRRNESAVWSQVSVTGAISACRQQLFEPIPPGTILDDVYWPLRVAMNGYRVVHDSRAIAYDRLPERTSDEFRRKVRTLAGNFQLAARLPQALLPWSNPIWLQVLSHKLSRLLVPWALLGLLLFSVLGQGLFFQAALAAQVVGYFLGVVGLVTKRGGKLISAAGSFLVLNTAAWVAFWVWITGRVTTSWSKVLYDRSKIVVPS